VTTAYVPSRTTPGMRYRVDIAIDGTPICTCPGFEHHGHCWHAEAVKKEERAMKEETALLPVKPVVSAALLPSARDLTLIDLAAAMAYAGAVSLPKELNTKEKVAAVMLYGYELGLKPMTAIRHIYIVEGRLEPSAEVMAGLLLASEPDARLSVVELTEESCTMRIIRPAKGINETYTVTMADAEKAGLAKRDGWLKYPKDRLRWHCTKRILRIYAPDATNAIEALEHPVPEAEWREVDNSELYNEGDIEPGEQQEPVAEVSAQPAVTASAPSPPDAGAQQAARDTAGRPAAVDAALPPSASAPAQPEPVAPIDLLNAIGKKYGAKAALEARAILPSLFGTADLLKIEPDQRREYAAMLRVRLSNVEHEHELAYGPAGHPLCSRCGAPLEERSPLRPQQPSIAN